MPCSWELRLVSSRTQRPFASRLGESLFQQSNVASFLTTKRSVHKASATNTSVHLCHRLKDTGRHVDRLFS